MRTQRGWAPVVALALAAAPAACSNRQPSPEPSEAPAASLLPMSIHGMPLLTVTMGSEAEALIRRLHGKDVAPVESYVGRYAGGGAEATLYVSRFPEAVLADSVLARMDSSIGAGNRTFAHHTRFEVDDLEVHGALGQGQVHFFFARGPDVAWLGIDRSMARVGLADLLGVRADDVPAGIVLGGGEILPYPDSLYRRGQSQPASLRPPR